MLLMLPLVLRLLRLQGLQLHRRVLTQGSRVVVVMVVEERRVR